MVNLRMPRWCGPIDTVSGTPSDSSSDSESSAIQIEAESLFERVAQCTKNEIPLLLFFRLRSSREPEF